ncbi:MAG: hypothetical protein ABI629_02735 [bacterium]
MPTLEDFLAVPRNVDGTPTLSADGAEFERYVEWLADYLYRPPAPLPRDPLFNSDRSAWAADAVGRLESRLADRIWNGLPMPGDPELEDAFDGARHADLLVRQDLSNVLSHVHDHIQRAELLRRLYSALNEDLCK